MTNKSAVSVGRRHPVHLRMVNCLFTPSPAVLLHQLMLLAQLDSTYDAHRTQFVDPHGAVEHAGRIAGGHRRTLSTAAGEMRGPRVTPESIPLPSLNLLTLSTRLWANCSYMPSCRQRHRKQRWIAA